MNCLRKLRMIEEERNILLPKVYKDFYESCSYFIPPNLMGTDVLNKYPDMQLSAFELLEDDGIENFLQDNDLVFMMHQGYQFWYFSADGNPDPTVFYYYEGKLKPENKGLFSKFIKEYM